MWYDNNGDGQFNAGDTALPAGVTVTIANSAGFSANTVTDSNGRYLFRKRDHGALTVGNAYTVFVVMSGISAFDGRQVMKTNIFSNIYVEFYSFISLLLLS